MASAFRDLFKFQIASRSGAGRLGVLVVASDKVARFFDQGVATYEQVVRLLPYMGIGLQLPTVVVGLDLNDWTPIRARYEEMRAVAEANGLDCHPFEAVFGVEQLEATRLTATLTSSVTSTNRSRMSHSQASTTTQPTTSRSRRLRASRSRLSSNLRAQNSGFDFGRFG